MPNVNGTLNLSTPNLPNIYNQQNSVQQRLSQSTYSVNNEQNNEQLAKTQKQQIALAIKSGKSPYEIYGLPDANEDDDWC